MWYVDLTTYILCGMAFVSVGTGAEAMWYGMWNPRGERENTT